mgnify:CR=1 FL=1
MNIINAFNVRYNDGSTSRRTVLRLDEQNPFTTMNFLKREFTIATAQNRSPEEVLELWSQVMEVPHLLETAQVSKGVRDSLHGIYTTLEDTDKELWLPEDVYRFYWDAAGEHGLSPKAFVTLPQPDIQKLDEASDNSIALFTNPLRPLGRVFNREEVNGLKNWLAQSEKRQLILDTVYSYQRSFDGTTQELMDTGQCYIVHSLSKAWLERGNYGILIPPANTHSDINWRSVLSSPSTESCTSAYTALEQETDLPYIQQEIFSHTWEKLTPRIQDFAPDFTPPTSGYFAAVQANAEEVLKQHNTHIIPASTFGSQNQDMSILSCLHDR